MNPFWITMSILGAATTGGALWLLARLFSYRHALHAGSGVEFTPERYEPMSRLLSPEDVEFLASQPGVERREIEEFERERRGILHSYLIELAGDFGTLHRQAREMVATAPEQHEALVGQLLSIQVSFWAALARIEFQMMLAPFGVKTVDVQRMIEVVGSLGAQVRPVAGPVPV